MARLRRESACSCDENNTAAHPTTLAELRRDDVNSTRCITLLVKLPSGTCGQTLVDNVVIREMSDHRYNTGCGLDVERCWIADYCRECGIAPPCICRLFQVGNCESARYAEVLQVVTPWRRSPMWDRVTGVMKGFYLKAV